MPLRMRVVAPDTAIPPTTLMVPEKRFSRRA
jgi:hypothetical protein